MALRTAMVTHAEQAGMVRYRHIIESLDPFLVPNLT